MTPTRLPEAATVAPPRLSTVIVASAAGTLIEWYDLFLAIILAPVLAEHLFPQSDVKFLETLAVVVSSYLVRPLGSLVFGAAGDRSGRKKSFLFSLLLMGAATFLVGCIPSFSSIGWLAPVLLLVFRLAQGMAISGEYAGAVIYVAEHAPPGKRGFYTGFIQSTAPFGLLVCLITVWAFRSLLTPAQFAAFGWRLPFLFSAVLVLLSFLVRRRLGESPVYARLKAGGGASQTPIADAFRTPGNRRRMLLAIFGGCAAQATLMQTAQFVTLFFLQREVFLQPGTAILVMAAAMLVSGPSFQLAAALSDRIGRKKVMLAGLLLSLLLIPLIFWLLLRIGNPGGIRTPHDITVPATLQLMGLSLLLNLVSALVYGPIGAFMLELFPPRIRYTSMGFAYNIGNGVLGGSTTLIGELLKTGVLAGTMLMPFAGLFYPLLLIVLALVVNAFAVPETYRNYSES